MRWYKQVKGLRRWHVSETFILSTIAVVVGLTSGVGVWAFKRLIDLFNLVLFGKLGSWLGQFGGWSVVLIPLAGGLVVGLIWRYFIGEERHEGVAGVIESVALAGSRLRYKRMPIKAIGAALSIGAGASIGPEDPSVQIGANLGSMFGQWLHLSDERMRSIVAAGAAAGIAAAFNAPIAGIFFALEIILGELSVDAFGVVVLASVVSAVVTQALSGPEPAFHVPAYAFNSIWELPLYLGLGLLAGPISAFYSTAFGKAKDLFNRLPVPPWYRPAIAGVLVGVVGIFLPQLFGVGYNTIDLVLANNPLPIMLLLVLLIGKLLLTPTSIGGGFPGGIIAPSLFLGATLGGAYGHVVALLFPTLNINPPAFAMVGMAAVLAGTVHAPLTAILLLFEMTNNYLIILPLMFAVVVSLGVSRRLQPDSVYSLVLARKGIRLERGRDVEVLQGITVSEVMHTKFDTLSDQTTLEEASRLFIKSRHHGFPVVSADGILIGIFTFRDLDKAVAENVENNKRPVGEFCTREMLVTYPDESIGTALRRMSHKDVGRLPVVDRDDPTHLLGLLRRSDLVRAYDLALSRRTTLRHRAHQIRLGTYTGVNVEEITIKRAPRPTGKRSRK